MKTTKLIMGVLALTTVLFCGNSMFADTLGVPFMVGMNNDIILLKVTPNSIIALSKTGKLLQTEATGDSLKIVLISTC